MDQDETPPIPAATLIVLRESPGRAPDLLVVERSARMAFAGGAMVFPGGRVDPADEDLAKRLGNPGAGARIAAIRETLEETGVAVALGPIAANEGPRLQDALHQGLAFAELIAREGLQPDLDALVPFARWMPAFRQPRRFDTLFFLAPAPPGEWQPVPQQGECAAAEWASAAELLERVRQGTASAIFPTLRNLERIARFESLAEARADALGHSLDTIIPWVEERDGEPHVCIPAGRGYPVTSQPLRTAFRA